MSIFRASQPPADPAATDPPAAPDDAALEAIRTAQLDDIRRQVTPLIEANAPGVVVANMVYDQAFLAPVAAGAGGGVLGVVGAMGGGDTVATATAAGLGALSLILAFMLVKRSTQTPPLPSLEELAGVPPTLPSDDELMGEASVVETSMDGVEIDEEELKSRHLAEQISELVLNSPADATGLLGRWVNDDS